MKNFGSIIFNSLNGLKMRQPMVIQQKILSSGTKFFGLQINLQ